MWSAELKAIHMEAHPKVVDSVVYEPEIFITRQFCVLIIQG